MKQEKQSVCVPSLFSCLLSLLGELSDLKEAGGWVVAWGLAACWSFN